jgi:hypothetical protein
VNRIPNPRIPEARFCFAGFEFCSSSERRASSSHNCWEWQPCRACSCIGASCESEEGSLLGGLGESVLKDDAEGGAALLEADLGLVQDICKTFVEKKKLPCCSPSQSIAVPGCCSERYSNSGHFPPSNETERALGKLVSLVSSVAASICRR